MINIGNVKKFCCEDITQIENYEKAINDDTQTWDCHHRKEIELKLSGKQLDELGLYFNRPASELIFLTHSEHISLHNKGKNNKGELNGFYGKYHTEESKQKNRESHLGKHHSEETKKKQSESHKGKNHPMYGKHHSEKSKQRMSEAAKRRWLNYHTKQTLIDTTDKNISL